MPECGRCGAAGLPAESRFCLRCGAPLADAEPVGAPYTPDHLENVLVLRDSAAGERKDVTVMIVDVAGSLAMAEALDPEDIHALMDGFFALALEAIHREGGMVNQFRGDGLMALFGAPRARGDDPARALRAALEVREQARTYAETVRARFGVPFTVRIGISTGLVWVGAIGNALRRDYTAEGPTVGIAARLEAAAAPGQILVGETTARRAAGRFELADLGSRELKGLAEPARVFELVAELAGARERGGPQTPFVGRTSEIAALRRALDAPGLRCAELRGEAGIGKSRLAREFARQLAPAVVTLELVSRESGAQRAYRPWLDLLRGWPQELRGAADATALLDALEGRVAAPASPEAIVQKVAALFSRALAKRRLLVLAEDAQWLDPSSRSVIAGLCADPPEGELAILATVRSEATEGWGAPAPLRTIRLAPLPVADSLRLAQGVLAPLEGGDDLAELAWRRGGGNPLFVEEVARSLRDGAEALRDAARTELALARMRERVPETLQGVVAARIDALPESAKRLLEAAAVVGEPFAPDLLCEVEPAVVDAAEPQLVELIERGLLARLPAGELDFCHGVVRSGAYAQLVRERRRALHRGVAEVLAKRPVSTSPDGAARIGHHYDEAGDAPEAARHLHRAGAGYTALRALREAIAHLGRAFELVRAGSCDEASLAAAIGLDYVAALGAQGRNGEAAAVLETLDLERASANDRLRLAGARVHAGWVRMSIDHEVARARRLIEQGIALASELPAETTSPPSASAISRASSSSTAASTTARPPRSGCSSARPRAAIAPPPRWLATRRRRRTARPATSPPRAAPPTSRSSRCAPRKRRCCAPSCRCRWRASSSRKAISRAAGAPPRPRARPQTSPASSGCAARRSGFSGAPSSSRAPARGASFLRGGARARRARLRVAPRCGARKDRDRRPGRSAGGARVLARARRAARRARALALRGFAVALGPGGRDEGEALLAEALDLCGTLGLRPSAAETHEFLAETAARRGDAARAAHHARAAADAYAACGMPLHAEQARARLDAA